MREQEDPWIAGYNDEAREPKSSYAGDRPDERYPGPALRADHVYDRTVLNHDSWSQPGKYREDEGNTILDHEQQIVARESNHLVLWAALELRLWRSRPDSASSRSAAISNRRRRMGHDLYA